MPASSCGIVIFGASGDLAKRKLIPAIYELVREKLLDEHSYIVGFGRTEIEDAAFREECKKGIAEFARSKPLDEEVWKSLESRLSYVAGDYGSPDAHGKLAATLDQLDKKHGACGCRLFYLSTPPEQFEPIITQLGERIRSRGAGKADAFERVIIEKPFGRDLKSAQALNALLLTYFKEEQIFRIDHYLGKETVQNLMVMRFANSIFEPIWNYKYINHVQITVAETVPVGSRGGYYDKSGALRDMVQNHIFQLMALVAMEPPAALDATAIRDEKVKVFRSIRHLRPNQIEDCAIRGRYVAGEVGGKPVPGYLQEKGVPAESKTETFAAIKLFIDNWRWSGTPFYIRTGKAMSKKLSEIAIRFRSPPLTLFQKQCETPVYPNDLIIRVAPEEGISLRFNGKVPGGAMNIKGVALDFQYKTAFNTEPPEAYERLIHDAMMGDQTLFIRGDEAEAAWQVIDPVEQGWAASKNPPQDYAPGSWGPKKASDLIDLDGRRWMHSGDDAEPVIACSL